MTNAPGRSASSRPHRELIEAIRATLAAHADPERAVGQQRYMRSRLPYLGLTSPTLRQVLRPVLASSAYRIAERAQWEATVRTLWDEATHREHWYAALALLGHRTYRGWRDPATLPLVEHLVRTGRWWDVVDDLATHRVRELLLDQPAEIAPALRVWARDEDLWIRRAAILAQVGAKERTDPVLLTDVIEPSISDPDFFARKAIGWALRDYARTDPEWVRAFVAARPELSPLSRREALKHL
jgi:3-methyladenine DNA glycosylase AlkD